MDWPKDEHLIAFRTIHRPSQSRLALAQTSGHRVVLGVHSGHTQTEVRHARLRAAPRENTGAEPETYIATTFAYVAILRSLNTQIVVLAASIGHQLAIRPDAHIVTSLARWGIVRAAGLLPEIAEAHGRFRPADSVTCLVGVAPSTRMSRKVKAVTFRLRGNRELRDANCDFAGDSRHANRWAADPYTTASARGHDHPRAARILAGA